MRKLSASSLQRIFACPASAVLEAEERPAGEAADDGTEIHGFLFRQFTTGKAEATGRTKARCEAIDLGALAGYWAQPGAVGELALAYNALSGKAEVLGVNIGREYPEENPGDIFLTIDLAAPTLALDYKTGRHRTDPVLQNWQLRLAAVALRALHQAPRIEVVVAYLQKDGSWDFDTTQVGAMECDGWSDELHSLWGQVSEVRQAVRSDQRVPWVYPTDKGCKWCPCIAACPAAGS
jgi:hypothetical protein